MEFGSDPWKAMIIDGARDLGLSIGRNTAERFAIHGAELVKWTEKTNLTSITDPEEVAVKHFLDSIASVPYISPGSTVLDIGSGGGFPGIPLRIVIADLAVTLIDASRKKVSFLKHIIRKLGLDRIDARHVRAEDLAAHPADTPVFDVIICRALSGMDTFVSLALPLLASQGRLIAMRGKTVETDLESARALILKMGGAPNGNAHRFTLTIKRYRLPFLESERSLLIMDRMP